MGEADGLPDRRSRHQRTTFPAALHPKAINGPGGYTGMRLGGARQAGFILSYGLIMCVGLFAIVVVRGKTRLLWKGALINMFRT